MGWSSGYGDCQTWHGVFVIVAPTSIVLSRTISPEYTAANPGFGIQMPNTKGTGTVVQIQVQAAGGSWSSLLINTTNTLNVTQDEYEKVSNPQTALSSGNKEARAIVDGVTSNVVSWTV